MAKNGYKPSCVFLFLVSFFAAIVGMYVFARAIFLLYVILPVPFIAALLLILGIGVKKASRIDASRKARA